MNSVYLQLVFSPRLILFRCRGKNIGWSEEINAVSVSAWGLMRSCGAEPGEGCSFVWVPSPLNSNKENSWSSIRAWGEEAAWGGTQRSSSGSLTSDEIKKLWTAAENKNTYFICSFHTFLAWFSALLPSLVWTIKVAKDEMSQTHTNKITNNKLNATNRKNKNMQKNHKVLSLH